MRLTKWKNVRKIFLKIYRMMNSKKNTANSFLLSNFVNAT